MKHALLFALAIVLAASAGYTTQKYLHDRDKVARATATDMIGRPRPEFAIRDIDGKIRNISDWDGKVVLLNFWATWCPPCLQEIPHFIELQREYGDAGLQVVGVAADNPEAASEFAGNQGMNYPVMAGEQEIIELARRYGNRIGALPYTVIIDRNATIHSTFAGELSKEQALKLVEAAGLDG